MALDISVTYDKNRVSIDSLIEELLGRPGCIVPFIGAGLSVSTGMPSWRNFLESFLQDGLNAGLLTSAEVTHLTKKLNQNLLEDVADNLWTSLGEPIFRDKLQYEFRIRGQRVRGAVRQVPLLSSHLVLTTNYDRVIETAWNEYLQQIGAGDQVEPLLPNNRDDFERALTGTGKFVFKLHGDVERPETWILTKRSYYEFYDVQLAPLPYFLERLLSNHIPLALGCSLNEERILHSMRSAKRTGFAILAFESQDKQRQIASRLRDLMKIIWLRPEDLPESGDIYELIDPLLAMIAYRARLGRIIWPIEPSRQPAWDAKLVELEANGKYEQGIKWITQNWRSMKSWELAVQLLHFSDLLGNPRLGLSKYFKLEESLRYLPCEPGIQHAIRYYRGRLFGQQGLIGNAIKEHEKNLPDKGLGDFFQLRSLFEIAQLMFRIEDFKKSWEMFQLLWQLVKSAKGQDRFAADVLKFLGTLEIIHIIHDLPFSLTWQEGDAEKCVGYADSAQYHAEQACYDDGKAWALTVKAFGFEGLGHYKEAKKAYERALQVCKSKSCRRSSAAHILVYFAGFNRRRGNLDVARRLLYRALRMVPGKIRPKDFSRIYEERALILNLQGKSEDSRKWLIKAMGFYARGSELETSSDWPIFNRLRNTCAAEGVQFNRFFRDG